MSVRLVIGMAGLFGALPAAAQDHAHHGTGMAMSVAPATDPTCAPEHAAMGHCTPQPKPTPPPPADPACPPEHAAMGHCAPKRGTPAEPGGTALPAGDAPPPPAARADAANRIWGAGAMAPARAAMMREHGGMTFSQVLLDRAEVQPRRGGDAYRWDGEAWFGGDRDRLAIRSEGEGAFGGRLGSAEVQALYSRAIGPYFNLQAGVRQDIRPVPARSYAVIGFEGLAPY